MLYYDDRPYHLSGGQYCWHLTRMDERDEDDERELPSTEVYASYRNDLTANQDALLLALIDLSKRPDTPVRKLIEHKPAPEPTLEERLVSALREFIRVEIGS